jgi:hypothetical protein
MSPGGSGVGPGQGDGTPVIYGIAVRVAFAPERWEDCADSGRPTRNGPASSPTGSGTPSPGRSGSGSPSSIRSARCTEARKAVVGQFGLDRRGVTLRHDAATPRDPGPRCRNGLGGLAHWAPHPACSRGAPPDPLRLTADGSVLSSRYNRAAIPRGPIKGPEAGRQA